MSTRFIARGLCTDGDEPRLLGGRHRDTGRIVFPRPAGDEAELYEEVRLSREGTLWSWTVQRFRPKTPPYAGPEDFEPFAIGYVELANETIVETRLVNVAFEALRIGMPLTLALIPFSTEPDGTIILTYAFRPCTAT